jgi:hypothetical protein
LPAHDHRERANIVVLALHALLALFVACHDYPATQDGPAHLYAAHVLRSLSHDPSSPYRAYFSANLHPVANSLFTYLALAVAGHAPLDWAVRLAMLLALWGLPLSVLAFQRALRAQAGQNAAPRLPEVSATSLACFLAYNYFLYRGLLNYALSLPLAMGCLAAVIATGERGISKMAYGARVGLALICGTLAGLAHPSAVGFLLVGIGAACVSGAGARKLAGAVAALPLSGLALASRVSGGRSLPVAFSTPLQSLAMFVRALGITYSWLEVVPVALVLGIVLRGAVRALARPLTWRQQWQFCWPLFMAVCMAVGYFFVPFEYGGLAGLNERIPLFVVLLLLPYAPVTSRMRFWLPVGFAAFSLYTAVQSVRVDAGARVVRDSHAADAIPRGSLVYAISLRVKNSALSVDLGRHVLADLAREHELVMGEVFCTHPAHVVQCTSLVPPMADLSAIQAFEHQSGTEQAASLADPHSTIRRSFDAMRTVAPHADYLLVVGADALDAAFARHVVAPLGAVALSNTPAPVRAYRMPIAKP